MIGFIWRSLIIGWVLAGAASLVFPMSETDKMYAFILLPMAVYLILELSSDLIARYIIKKQDELGNLEELEDED